MSYQKKEQATNDKQADTAKDLTDDQLHKMSGGAQNAAARIKTDGSGPSRSRAEDDVIVDGRIITAENYDY